MDSSHDNDIQIGEGQWISWVELDPRAVPLNIDPFLRPTFPFWKLLETNCVSACCGIDALALWPKDIESAASQVGVLNIRQDFETLRQEIFERAAPSLMSSFLNNMFDCGVFLQLIDHILLHLDGKQG